MKIKDKLQSFKIETTDTGCISVFLTTAFDSKQALGNLIFNSSGFKNIISSDKDITIKITKLK